MDGSLWRRFGCHVTPMITAAWDVLPILGKGEQVGFKPFSHGINQ